MAPSSPGSAVRLVPDTAIEPTLTTMALTDCSLCASGVEGECHVPGCAFWMKTAPGVPLRNEADDQGVVILGSDMEVTSLQRYANGTVQMTIKPETRDAV
jgi:hypothetical protein